MVCDDNTSLFVKEKNRGIVFGILMQLAKKLLVWWLVRTRVHQVAQKIVLVKKAVAGQGSCSVDCHLQTAIAVFQIFARVLVMPNKFIKRV